MEFGVRSLAFSVFSPFSCSTDPQHPSFYCTARWLTGSAMMIMFTPSLGDSPLIVYTLGQPSSGGKMFHTQEQRSEQTQSYFPSSLTLVLM